MSAAIWKKALTARCSPSFPPLLEIERELEEINHRLQAKAGNLDELIERQAALTERFEREGGLTCRARARSALMGLGFDDTQMAQPIAILSGGAEGQASACENAAQRCTPSAA